MAKKLLGITCMPPPDLLARTDSKRTLQRLGHLSNGWNDDAVRQGFAECDNPAIQSVASVSNENWIEESAYRQKDRDNISLRDRGRIHLRPSVAISKRDSELRSIAWEPPVLLGKSYSQFSTRRSTNLAPNQNVSRCPPRIVDMSSSLRSEPPVKQRTGALIHMLFTSSKISGFTPTGAGRRPASSGRGS